MAHAIRAAALPLVCALSLITLPEGRARAADYPVRKVAKSETSPPLLITGRPSIDDTGLVSFQTGIPGGGTPNTPGSAMLTQVRPDGTRTNVNLPFGDAGVGQATVSASGTTTFLGKPLLRISPGGTITRLIENGNGSPYFNLYSFAASHTNDAAPVIFDSDVGGGERFNHGIFAGPNPATDRIDNPEEYGKATLVGLGRGDEPRFIASGPFGGKAVYKGPNPQTDMVMRLPTLDFVSRYQENARGDVLFIGTRQLGTNSFESGLYKGPDLVADRVVMSDPTLHIVGAFLNDNGQRVIETLNPANDALELFAGTNAATDRILGSGDALFGSTLQTYYFDEMDQQAFNNRGELVFRYVLANGEDGVAAVTVPEPAAAALLLLPRLALVRRRR